MRTVIRWTLTAVLGGFVCVAPAISQSGYENFAEIVGWLQANFGGAACIVFDMGASRASLEHITEGTEVTFSECDMTLATSNTMGRDVSLHTYRIPMGKLNPAEVKLSEGVQVPDGWITSGEVPARTLILVTTAEAKLIDVKQEQLGDHASNPSEYKTSEIRFHIRNEQDADKLAKTLSRAIMLCGGTGGR